MQPFCRKLQPKITKPIGTGEPIISLTDLEKASAMAGTQGKQNRSVTAAPLTQTRFPPFDAAKHFMRTKQGFLFSSHLDFLQSVSFHTSTLSTVLSLPRSHPYFQVSHIPILYSLTSKQSHISSLSASLVSLLFCSPPPYSLTYLNFFHSPTFFSIHTLSHLPSPHLCSFHILNIRKMEFGLLNFT